MATADVWRFLMFEHVHGVVGFAEERASTDGTEELAGAGVDGHV